MPQTIEKITTDLVKETMTPLPAINAKEALSLAGSRDHVFVDLRDGTEQAKTSAFFRASGGRSALAAEVAMEMGFSPLGNMSGGGVAWKKAGGTLE